MSKSRMTPDDFMRFMAASKILAESGDLVTARELADKAAALVLSRKIKRSEWQDLRPIDELLRAKAWLPLEDTEDGRAEAQKPDAE